MNNSPSFAEKLLGACEARNSVLVAGFDPRIESLPEIFLEEAEREAPSQEERTEHCLTAFFECFIEAGTQRVCAVKPNIAFFEQLGIGGLRALRNILKILREREVISILDVKRGDIGSTAEAYARAFFEPLRIFDQTCDDFLCDAVTLSPFLGKDSLEPFLERCQKLGKGVFILLKTSNAGAADLQDCALTTGDTVSDKVLDLIPQESATGSAVSYSPFGVVVGATKSSVLSQYRTKLPKSIFLVPGFGAQGGGADELKPAFDAQGLGAVVNSSRGLLKGIGKGSSKNECTELIRRNIEAANKALNGARF